ncbi:aminoglycoside 3'-phosphotransferase [Nonomuraea sp. NPDC049419]|uniref:aminoglycoside 3'-phosphotransferase n=1 Tax=Nonomuraea sp. NPDC049419 TaxID=3155772 RepID=UPI0034436E3A
MLVSTEAPAVIAALAGDDTVTLVWRNELGGLTYRLDGARVRYAKWVAAGTPEIDLTAEAERLTWASRWVAVPPVLEHGTSPGEEWLVTAAVPGVSAVAERWRAEPEVVARAIGRGLRLLHDTLPASACPYDWSVERRLRRARERFADGEGPDDWSPEHRHLGLDEARAIIERPPPIDRLVVCHGDACVPNTLLHDDGTFAAHVDLGSLGVADRWADLAVAAWSLDHDFGPGHDAGLYEGYGIEPDPVRVAYYRLLWDLA